MGRYTGREQEASRRKVNIVLQRVNRRAQAAKASKEDHQVIDLVVGQPTYW
jgi:hypothetical protein